MLCVCTHRTTQQVDEQIHAFFSNGKTAKIELFRAACLQNEIAPEKLLQRYEKRFEKREKRSEKNDPKRI